MPAVSFMVLLEDDALEVGYSNGSRLQLSPCGSEFVLEERPPASAHPLQTPRRLRRRTRFVTSTHKELLVQALDFRNRFATRPYLPEELLPMERRKVCFTDISEVEWPSFSEYSSCDRSLGPSREFVISSLDGNARLQLSPWGEEFSAVFLCRVSQDKPQKASGDCPGSRPASQCGKNKGKCSESLSDLRKRAPRVSGQRGEALPGSQGRPSSPPTEPPTAHPGRTYLCTWVTQQHSCSFPPLLWRHPLSLAIQLRTVTMWEELSRGETTSGMEKGSLPQALPLRCFFPHQHRWWCRDSTGAQGALECGLHDKLLKVMWIQGVLYRVTTHSAVTMIEVFPGDGSVIRSSSTLPGYFTHHTVGREGQGTEKTYLLSSLPPDVPGQLYSMRSLVARAARIMKCYNEAKYSLKLPPSHCCWQEESSRSEASVVTLEPHALGCPGHQGLLQSHLSEQSWSAEAELAKIKRFNYLLDHSRLLRSAGISSGSGGPGNSQPEFLGIPAMTHEEMSRKGVTASLRRTSDTIRDIEVLYPSGRRLYKPRSHEFLPPAEEHGGSEAAMAHISSVQARRAALEGALSGKSGNTPEPPRPAFKAKLLESQSSGGPPRAPPPFTKPPMPKSSLGGVKPTPAVSSVLPKPYQVPEWPKNKNSLTGSPKPIREPGISPFAAPEPEKQAEMPLKTKSNVVGGNKFSNISPMSSTPPVSSSKPSLNPPTTQSSLHPNSQAQEGDPSTPRKKTLPNIFSLGNAPPKPNRPPKVNLEMFTGDRGCVKDDPKQKMGGASCRQPVAPPPAPSLPLRAPLAKAHPELEEEESYDDVGLSGAPPPPPGGHPSKKPEDKGDEDMYDDIEELSKCCRTPKDSKEMSEQEKKHEKDKKKRIEQERKEQKEREKREQEVRKRFKITGPIQVIHTARAYKDCKGGKNDLSLKEGQTIEIVRISDNPDGRWLARTHEGSYGYVKTTAVEVEGASQAQTGRNNSEEFPPPLEEDEIYNDVDDGDLNLPPLPNLDESNEGLGAASGDEVYDEVDGSAFPPPPPINSLPQLKPKGKLEEKDPKKQKKLEKEEKDFRKKFKYTGEITVMYQVTVVPVLTSKKWGNKDLPLKPGEIIDAITKPVDNKLIGRNQDGKFGYVSTSNIVQGDTDHYDDVGEGCIYDND